MQTISKNDRKTIIIASFVPVEMLDWFLKYLKDKFNIENEDVYIYEIEDDRAEVLLTFKIEKDKKIDLKLHFIKAAVVNTKSGCIFSINGLNKLIELNNKLENGNVDHKSYNIDWELYKNKLILCNKENLIIKNIKKIKKNSEKKQTSVYLY